MERPANRLEVLAFADELSERPELLAAWAEVFQADDPVRLLIHPGTVPPDQIDELLNAAMLAAGLRPDTELDLQAFSGPLTEAEADGMSQRCVFVLTRSPPRSGFDGLIGVSDEEVWQLRDRLPYPWAQFARAPAAFQTLEHAGIALRFRETDADRGVLTEVLADEAYKLEDCFDPWPGLKRYSRPDPTDGGTRRLIIDAGANIGVSTVYFAARYPQSIVVALEPEAENFELLEENTRRFPNVVPLNKAIASERGRAPLSDPGSGSATFRVGREIAKGQILGYVDTVTVADMMAAFEETEPFLAKIAIEGGEAELFGGDAVALSRFPAVAVELHERLFPGLHSARPFLRWHLEHNRDLHQADGRLWSFDSRLARPSR